MIKAVQQIMLGGVVKNEKTALNALRRIKSAGYDAIELNRFMLHPSGLLVRLLTRAAGMPAGSGGKLNWRAIIKESGLGVIALHADLGSLEREPENIIAEARSFGTQHVVITGMYRFDYSSIKNLRALAKRLNSAGAALRDAGLTLCYHNHNVELTRLSSGVCALDMIIAETDPALVGFELDTYWLADSGANTLEWMRKLGARMKLWHAADRGVRLKGTPMTPIVKADCCELGYGAMNLDALYEAARENGASALILETHKIWIDGDPLKSLEKSALWLKGEDR